MQLAEGLIVIVLLWSLHQRSYGFVLLSSSVAAGNSRIFEHGTGQSYQYESTVILNEPAGTVGKDVGYQILADVSVAVVWQSSENKYNKLLEFEVSWS